MKKIISLLLALALVLGCLFTFAACGEEQTPDDNNNDNVSGDDSAGDNEQGGGDQDDEGTDAGDDDNGTTDGGDNGGADDDDDNVTVKNDDIYTLVAENAPTKIVTKVDYDTKDGISLPAFYTMSIEGSNSILEYEYSKIRTFEENLEDGVYDRIKVVEGVVYYKDGKYSEDGINWSFEAPSANISVKFDLKEEYLTDAVINEDGTVLEAKVSAENAVKIWGSNFDAKGDIELKVETNGKALSRVYITYTTASDASVSISTSYTSAPIALEFPAA